VIGVCEWADVVESIRILRRLEFGDD